MRPRNFFVIFVSVFLLLWIGYYGAFKYQLGAHVKAEWWLKNIYSYKEYIAKSSKSPRVIIVSGSNALIGIDSALIEKIVGRDVVNLALHAGLNVHFYSLLVEEHAGYGDTVVLPLEFHMYSEKPTDWLINNMLAWGWEDYLSKLSGWEMLDFLADVPPLRVVEGIFKQTGKNPVLDREVAVQKYHALATGVPRNDGQYVSSRLNSRGDYLMEHGITESLLRELENPIRYIQQNFDDQEPSRLFLKGYQRLQKLQTQRALNLIFTWPATIRNAGFDLSVPAYRERIERFERWLAKAGIKIQCSPALFNLDAKYFFDTKYHLNRVGALIRSENLGNCIKTILGAGSEPNWSHGQALSIVQAQEARYAAEVERLPRD